MRGLFLSGGQRMGMYCVLIEGFVSEWWTEKGYCSQLQDPNRRTVFGWSMTISRTDRDDDGHYD